MKKTLPLICSLALLACGQAGDRLSQTSDTGRPSEHAGIAAGTFKMYGQARVKPESFCDLYTVLSLASTGDGIIATLSNGLSGICEIAVAENLRSYRLEPVATSCGSTTYKGVLTTPADSRNVASAIELTDHRARTCRDLQPARVIVRQFFADAKEIPLYSHDEAVVPAVTLKGTLVQIVAVGGESTGFGIRLANDDIIEIALESQDLLTNFEEGKSVEISGFYRTVYGVEIPERQVLVVESMTLL